MCSNSIEALLENDIIIEVCVNDIKCDSIVWPMIYNDIVCVCEKQYGYCVCVCENIIIITVYGWPCGSNDWREIQLCRSLITIVYAAIIVPV